MPSTDDERCPRCGQGQLQAIVVDGEIPVSVCSSCQASFGVDDSMDAEVLRRLLDDEDVEVKLTVVRCTKCGNDDMELFTVVDEEVNILYLGVTCATVLRLSLSVISAVMKNKKWTWRSGVETWKPTAVTITRETATTTTTLLISVF
jgi:uncharacterized protein (DUF983 family)